MGCGGAQTRSDLREVFLTSSLRHRVLIPRKHGDLSILVRPLGLHLTMGLEHRILVHDQLGVVSLPSTLAEGRSSMRWMPVISPLTVPSTMIDAALIVAVTAAFSPIVTLSAPVISPSYRPSIGAGP
jgi:hypothetical protein